MKAFDTTHLSSLSIEQKACIITALKWISGHKFILDEAKDNELISKTANLLKINLDLPILKAYEMADDKVLFNVLKYLKPDEKIWFVIELYVMATYDGNVERNPVQVAFYMAREIGISDVEYLELIEMAFDINSMQSPEPFAAEQEIETEETETDSWSSLVGKDPFLDAFIPFFRKDNIDYHLYRCNYWALEKKTLGILDEFLFKDIGDTNQWKPTKSLERMLRLYIPFPVVLSPFFVAAYPEVASKMFIEVSDRVVKSREQLNLDLHMQIREAFKKTITFECACT